MSEYKDEDLKQDSIQYMGSQLGIHHMSVLTAMQEGFLSQASSISEEHPDRYLAKYSAIKEVIEFLKSPLDDDTPSRG